MCVEIWLLHVQKYFLGQSNSHYFFTGGGGVRRTFDPGIMLRREATV